MASINLLNKVSIIFMLVFSSFFKDFYKLKKVFIKSSYTTSDLYQHRKNPLRAVSSDFQYVNSTSNYAIERDQYYEKAS